MFPISSSDTLCFVFVGKDKVGKSETPGKVSYMGSLEVPFSEVPRFCDVNESFRNLRKCSRSYNLSCKLGNGFPALCFRNNYRRVFECLAPSFFGSPVCCDYTC